MAKRKAPSPKARSSRVAAPAGCPHPKSAEEKVLTANGKAVVLVRCGDCGGRVR